jgi:malonyl-CoA O-methyltransferase
MRISAHPAPHAPLANPIQTPARISAQFTVDAHRAVGHMAIMPLHDRGERDYEVVPVREGYDRWSEVYDAGNNALLVVEEPVVDDLLGEISGRSVLDLGTGTGRHAIRLAAAGAQVTAVDLSPGMLAKAQAKEGAETVTWLQHDMAEPLPFVDGCIERVVCALVLEHVPELVPAFREMRRVCAPEGLGVITCMHPAMMLRGVLAHFADPVTGRDVQPRSVPHEIADFVNAAIDGGWTIDRMVERPVNEALLGHVPRMDRHLGWPLLLALRLR